LKNESGIKNVIVISCEWSEEAVSKACQPVIASGAKQSNIFIISGLLRAIALAMTIRVDERLMSIKNSLSSIS